MSGLATKANKCVLIPLGEELTDTQTHVIREWLRKNIPHWRSFEISSSGKYFGFQVGPGVEEVDGPRKGPERKWTQRAELLAKSKLTPGFGVAQYNTRSVTTLSYMARLYPVPDRFAKKEK